MKKLINDPADVVTEALRGVELAHPQLRVDHENKVVFRGDAPVQGKVGIVSGGGSGHEPLQGGFVGPGGLDAACAGEVFTSPVPDQMLAATKGVDGGAGVLHIVLNYTGDIMNFEMAAELAAAEDVQVETVIMNDDVAVEDSLYTAGRRGVGGHHPAQQDRRSGRGRGPRPGGRRRGLPQGHRQRAQHGHGADLLHRPGRRAADLRPARRPDGGRHRRARRAGPPPAADRAGQGDRRDARRADPQGPRLHRRRRRARVRQRHGRHAAARALPHVRRGGADPGAVRACRWPAPWSGTT